MRKGECIVNIKIIEKIFGNCVTCITLGAMLALFGCNHSMTHTGKYVDEKEPQNFFELKKEGIVIIVQGNESKTGKYLMDGNNVTLILDSGGAAQGKIEGKTFIEKGGGRYTLQ